LLAATSTGDQVAAKLLNRTEPLADAEAEAEPDAEVELEDELEEEEDPLVMLLTQKSWFPESIAQTASRRGLTT